MATAIEFLGHQPLFITALGRDNLAQFALAELDSCGLGAASGRLKVSWLEPEGAGRGGSSSCFALVLMDSLSGQCEYVVANLAAAGAISAQTIEEHLEAIKGAPLVVIDANLAPETIERLIELCHQLGKFIFLEPTDVVCLRRLVACLAGVRRRRAELLSSLAFMSPNLVELREMLRLFWELDGANTGGEQAAYERPARDGNQVEEAKAMAEELIRKHLPELKCLLVTMDRGGLLVVSQFGAGAGGGQAKLIDELNESSNSNSKLGRARGGPTVWSRHFAAEELPEGPVSGSGAGDSLASGFVSGLLEGADLVGCVAKGLRAARLALEDKDTIPRSLRELRKKTVATAEARPDRKEGGKQ